MKNTCIGIIAHVDAGKTTMSEAMLYKSGKIKTPGRVDHKDAYLDNFRQERERGITIFSKQAIFDTQDLHISLLDTPGHMDFSAETERTLSVLDYAILVISGPEGVQAHTETLWSLLSRYKIPTFIWVNKMDICLKDHKSITEDLAAHLKAYFIDFCDPSAEENTATVSEEALEQFLDRGFVSSDVKSGLFNERKFFPVWFGSALKMEGVEEFLKDIGKLIPMKKYPLDFSARIFKISRDETGNRLSWMKITGGSLKVRSLIEGEKITQLRLYSGAKFSAVDEVSAGTVCCALGLEHSYAGQGLGTVKDSPAPVLEPVLTYTVILPGGCNSFDAYRKLLALGEEDPSLRIVWNSGLSEIQLKLMGEVQTEVLKEEIKDRFDLDVNIDEGKIMYRETIASPAEGVGHYEPLRHYAEVHLLLEPLPRGAGIVIESACSTDDLDLNWQRLILSNISEKTHVGVLTGSPITDIKITLVAARAHLKHTEGGDFRQASCRAVRQGLMCAENVLLEPWYSFRLELPSEHIGRAISDVKAMGADFGAPESFETTMALSGRVPVSEMRGYQTVLLSYTKGRGRLSCRFAGYYPCHNTEKVIEEYGYNPDRDVDNSADSVFCSHGAGVNVKWNCVRNFMHIDSGIHLGSESIVEIGEPRLKTGNMDFDEKELEAVMKKMFGEASRPRYIEKSAVSFGGAKGKNLSPVKKDYYIVDGYNVIFGWEDMAALAKDSFEAARTRLMDILCNFKAYRGCDLVLVFDGYKAKNNPGSNGDYHGIRVVYTKEGLSADGYIESLAHDIRGNYNVRIVSSDGLIQLTALRMGISRMSSRELKYETDLALSELSDIMTDNNRSGFSFSELARLQK